MRVKDIMDASPNLLRTSDTFEHLIKTLDEVKYRVVFVVDKEDKLVGVVTEADLVKVLIPKYLSIDELLIPAMDENYKELEWSTLFYFIGLFIVVSGVIKVGLISKISDSMVSLTKPNAENMFFTAIVILWFSALVMEMIILSNIYIWLRYYIFKVYL